MRDHCAGPSAGCSEVRNLKPRAVGGGKSLRYGRPADISSANKQYVQEHTPRSNTQAGRTILGLHQVSVCECAGGYVVNFL
jgi:hypothetical protein